MNEREMNNDGRASDGLWIYYSGAINTELDDALREVVLRFGYKMWASGYELGKGMRDMAFEQPVFGQEESDGGKDAV